MIPLPQDWLQPLASALGVVVALQVPYFLLRKSFPRLLDRLRYQLWALALGLLSFEVFAREELLSPRLFGVAAFFAVVLSIDVGWRGFERFFLARRHDERGRPAIPQLVRDVSGWILLVAAIVLAGREFFGWDVGKLALQSAVLSAILGFALQDVLKNVFAGLLLCLGLSLGFFSLTLLMSRLGAQSEFVQPGLAAWLPVIICGSIGLLVQDFNR